MQTDHTVMDTDVISPEGARSSTVRPAASSRPVRVLFLTSCVRGGGPGWSLLALLKHLDRTLIEPVVAIPDSGFIAERLEELGIPYKIIPRLPERLYTARFNRTGPLTKALSVLLNLRDGIRAWHTLTAFIRTERFDVIYCNNMLVKPIGAFAGLFTETPVILHARNIHDTFLRRNVLVQLARLSVVKQVICISETVEAAYRFSGKTDIVHNGVDLQIYHPERVRGRLKAEHGLAPDTPIVGYLGRLVPWKGVDILIQAAQQVMRRHPQVHFCIVGDNPVGATRDLKADYQAQAHRLGIADRMHFVGFQDDVRPYLKDFDMLVLPSKKPEPFGRVNIEAMAMGIPVIATAQGGPLEIIEDGVNGRLIPSNDAKALSQSILEMLTLTDKRRDMGRQARTTVQRRFDAMDVAQRISRHICAASGKVRNA